MAQSRLMRWLLSAAAMFGFTGIGAGKALADDWTGGYVGGSLGHVSGDSDAKVALGGNWSAESAALQSGVRGLWSNKLGPDGVTFTAYGGLSQQFDSFVLAGELTAEVGRVKATRLTPQTATPAGPLPTYAVGNSVEVKDTFGARVLGGVVVGEVLLYGAVGYVSANVEMSAEVLSSGGYSKRGVSSDRTGGWTLSAGVEGRMGSGWSWRLEGQRTTLDDVSYATAYRPGSTFVSPAYTERVSQDVELDAVKFGVSYRF